MDLAIDIGMQEGGGGGEALIFLRVFVRSSYFPLHLPLLSHSLNRANTADHSFSILCIQVRACSLTDHFTILEPQSMPIAKFCVVQKRRFRRILNPSCIEIVPCSVVRGLESTARHTRSYSKLVMNGGEGFNRIEY